MSEFRLIKEILNLSHSATWERAKNEWHIEEVYDAEEPETCLCGHFPIIEICILINNRNSNQATVGNCCVKKFIGLSSDKIFASIKRIKKDLSKAINLETIDYARQKGWITEWEESFYIDTAKKRKLTEKQMDKRIQINRTVLSKVKSRSKQRG